MAAEPDYSDLSAVFVNCTLKRSPEVSNTQGLMDASIRLMREHGVAVERIRFVDHDVATGVYPDMREYGWQYDAWPDEIWPKVEAADILVIGGPIWLGDNSSVTKRLVERLYAMSGEQNARGQDVYYGKVGGAIITGNEDGIKHAETMSIERRARVIATASSRSPPGSPSEPKFDSRRPCGVRPKPIEKITRSRLWATACSSVSTVNGSARSRRMKSERSVRLANAASTDWCTRAAWRALAVMTMSDSRGRFTACSMTSSTTFMTSASRLSTVPVTGSGSPLPRT